MLELKLFDLKKFEREINERRQKPLRIVESPRKFNFHLNQIYVPELVRLVKDVLAQQKVVGRQTYLIIDPEVYQPPTNPLSLGHPIYGKINCTVRNLDPLGGNDYLQEELVIRFCQGLSLPNLKPTPAHIGVPVSLNIKREKINGAIQPEERRDYIFESMLSKGLPFNNLNRSIPSDWI